MRRPPAVGLVVLMLLGGSGCAAFPERWGSSQPAALREDGADPAPGLFSWWRPRTSATRAASGDSSDPAQGNQPAARSVATTASGDVWPESRSEWMTRNFPRLSRLLNQDTTELRRRQDIESLSRLQSSRAAFRSQDATASSARADDEVRPVDSRSIDDPPVDTAARATRPLRRNQPSRSPTAPSVEDRSDDLPESISADDLKIAGATARRDALVRSGGQKPAPADAQVPQKLGATEPWVDGPVPVPGSGSGQTAGPPASETGDVPTPPFDDDTTAPEPAIAAADGPDLDSPSNTPLSSAPPLESAPRALTDEDTRMAQAPAQQPARQIPPPPPIPDEAKPSDSPPAPPAAPAPGATPKPASPPPAPAQPAPATPAPAQPAPPTPAQPAPPTPAPAQPAPASAPPAAATQASAPPAVSGQGTKPAPTAASPIATAQTQVMGSAQPIYASPSPVASSPHRCKLCSWLHRDRAAEPLPSPQLPPATFPTSYRLASPAPQAAASGQSGPSNAAPCDSCASVKAPKKPCFLKTWIQHLKSGWHEAACGACRKTAPSPCCQPCPCCDKAMAVSPSPQANPAPLRLATTTAQASPGSTGQGAAAAQVQVQVQAPAQPSSRGLESNDVAQRGRVAESAASQAGDKPPQG